MRSSVWLNRQALGTGSAAVAAMLALLTPSIAGAEVEGRSGAQNQVEDFIRGTGVASGTTPVARWVRPVCPRVLGLQAEATRVAEARMRATAERIGAEVAPEPCDSNIVVTFAQDAAGVVQEVRRISGRTLADVPRERMDDLLNSEAPIRWWYVTQIRGRYGEGERNPGVGGQGRAQTGAPPSYAFEGDMMHYDSSLISTFQTRVMTSASVLVDLNAVMGRRLTDVIDYATLVALAEIRSPDYAGPGSVLGMFGSSDRPAGLTAQDEAFLRAFYRLPLDRQASRHRGQLTREMTAAQTGD
jgi:hypothetical protein